MKQRGPVKRVRGEGEGGEGKRVRGTRIMGPGRVILQWYKIIRRGL